MANESDDPLAQVFDVLVCGTGLAACITSAALARNGKSVIHIDALDFYGEDSASFPLSQFVSQAKKHQLGGRNGNKRAEDITDGRGPHVSSSPPTASDAADAGSAPTEAIVGASNVTLLAPSDTPTEATSDASNAGAASGKSTSEGSTRPSEASEPADAEDDDDDAFFNASVKPLGSLEEIKGITIAPDGKVLFEGDEATVEAAPATLDWEVKFHGVHPIPEALEKAKRHITIDLLPCLTLARGAMIDALIRSQVAESYLEFVMLQAACMVESSSSTPQSTAASDKVPEGKVDDTTWLLRKLPTSKSDIFLNDFLTLSDKRKLMKFLQFALDLRTVSTDGTAIDRLNEHVLGLGRSLLRPQNKSTPSFDFDAWKNRPFPEFLKHCELREPLQNLMMYAVALLPRSQAAADAEPVTADEGMRRLTKYLGGLGRYGDTAFVVPRYGHGEFSQAFSRACAVHGGIYMLRAVPTHYISHSTSRHYAAVRLADGTVIKAKHVISSPRYVPVGSANRPTEARVMGTTVCILSHALPNDFILGKVTGAAGTASQESTLVTIVIPPHAIGLDNEFPVYVLQQSRANLMTPGDLALVSIWTCTQDRVNVADAAGVNTVREATVAITDKVANLITAAAGTSFCLWRQAYSTLVPIINASASTESSNWTALTNHPDEVIRLTNEHDALQALTAFMKLSPPEEFFKEKAVDDADAALAQADAAPPSGGSETGAEEPLPADGSEDFDVKAALALLRDDE